MLLPMRAVQRTRPLDTEFGAVVTSLLANASQLSAEIDLGDVFEEVTLTMSEAEAAELGAASETGLHAAEASGGTFSPVFLEDMSAQQTFTKPASGGVRVTYTNVNARFIKVSSSVNTTAQVDFTVRGRKRQASNAIAVRSTLPFPT